MVQHPEAKVRSATGERAGKARALQSHKESGAGRTATRLLLSLRPGRSGAGPRPWGGGRDARSGCSGGAAGAPALAAEPSARSPPPRAPARPGACRAFPPPLAAAGKAPLCSQRGPARACRRREVSQARRHSVSAAPGSRIQRLRCCSSAHLCGPRPGDGMLCRRRRFSRSQTSAGRPPACWVGAPACAAPARPMLGSCGQRWLGHVLPAPAASRRGAAADCTASHHRTSWRSLLI